MPDRIIQLNRVSKYNIIVVLLRTQHNTHTVVNGGVHNGYLIWRLGQLGGLDYLADDNIDGQSVL